jgi:hypothetical protein
MKNALNKRGDRASRRRGTVVKLTIAASCFVASIAGGQDTKCPIDSMAPWAMVSRNWSREAGATWSNDSLRRALLALERRDQEPRREFGKRVGDTTYLRRLIQLDQETSAEVQGILDRFGLPTRSMVGAAGASALFLVVQHSATLQQRVLDLAKRAPEGEVPPSALAMLEDRVLANSGRPQVYGTHFNITPEGLVKFAPIDSRDLASRRERAGLPPLDVYLCLVEESGLRVDRSTLPP